MTASEPERYRLGDKQADFYARALGDYQARQEWLKQAAHYVRAEDQPWEYSRHGKLKHLVNEHMNAALASMDVFILELPPGGASGRHRHFAEEFVFVIEGRGYDLHWDADPGITETGYTWPIPPEDSATRWDWERHDSIFIPPMVIHQHFNADPDRTARIICAMSRAYRAAGFAGIDQIVDAPDAGQVPVRVARAQD